MDKNIETNTPTRKPKNSADRISMDKLERSSVCGRPVRQMPSSSEYLEGRLQSASTHLFTRRRQQGVLGV